MDANFRTLADKSNRAMAGLSMGGMETRAITLARPEVFAYYGLLSGGIKAVSFVSENTAHEWHSWRRSLHEFAPLLFK